ncbi:MAG: ABC transporter ATP-binding protein [Deltaproteobacteria bacterium]|nr:ABC transporter ATP-binding protein [Deltaproteobacteria bacterium]
MGDPLMVATALERSFVMGDEVVRALRGVDFVICKGEHVAIIGPSGSGKSTLMYVLGCLDTPSGGTYSLADYDVSELNDDELAALRNRYIGFVFQSFNLIPRTTTVDNVALPLRYAGVGVFERRRIAKEALERVGLGHRLDHTPDRLSGGERQRVAIARAIVTKPELLLCDEPTGNLDSRVGGEISKLFEDLNRDLGVTLVIVTHDPAMAKRAQRNIKLVDGSVVYDGAPVEGR